MNIAAGGGRIGKERQKREIDEIVRELSIIREQLRHPNVVRYLSSFQESKITMDGFGVFLRVQVFSLFDDLPG